MVFAGSSVTSRQPVDRVVEPGQFETIEPSRLPFAYARFVEFADTDAAGIVHYSVLIRYMESAEHALLRHLGLTIAPTANRAQTILPAAAPSGEPALASFAWPRVKVECDFRSPAYFEDQLDVRIGVQRIGRGSIQYAAAVVGEQQQLICTGRTVVAACTRQDRRLVPATVPALWRERLEQMRVT